MKKPSPSASFELLIPITTILAAAFIEYVAALSSLRGTNRANGELSAANQSSELCLEIASKAAHFRNDEVCNYAVLSQNQHFISFQFAGPTV